jgi:hypothetical protein
MIPLTILILFPIRSRARAAFQDAGTYSGHCACFDFSGRRGACQVADLWRPLGAIARLAARGDPPRWRYGRADGLTLNPAKNLDRVALRSDFGSV